MDISGVSRARIRKVIDRWLPGSAKDFAHLIEDAAGDKELRVLVDYPDTLVEKKRICDLVVANLRKPSGRPRIRFIVVDEATRPEGEHQRIRVLGSEV